MATHTPGPWQSFGASTGKRAPVGVLDGKRNIRIADVGDRGQIVKEIDANARLIAAAPDLLAFAREFVRCCDASVRNPGKEGYWFDTAYNEAKAAIAKAESP